ncbi:MAG: hypothetical protein AAFY46_07805 [Planctomycetota bacterium]
MPVATAHIKIELRPSRSQNFARAVDLLRKHDGYETSEDGDKQLHTVEADVSIHDRDAWDTFFAFAHMAGNWKGTAIELQHAGSPIPTHWAHDANEHYFNVTQCEEERAKRGEDYCFARSEDGQPRSFGCRHLTSVTRTAPSRTHFTLDARSLADEHWVRLGQLQSDEVTVLTDRDRVLSVLNNEIDSSRCGGCRFFERERVASEVARLPDAVQSMNCHG